MTEETKRIVNNLNSVINSLEFHDMQYDASVLEDVKRHVEDLDQYKQAFEARKKSGGNIAL